MFATGKTPGGLLHYDIATDRWGRPGVSAGEDDGLAVVGDSLLIYTRYAENGHIRDRILDGTGLRYLPPDPLAPSGLRSLVPIGDDRLILFAHPIDHTLGKRPTFVRAAELDLGTGKWRLLPKSNIVGGQQWWLTDGLLVAPSWGVLDGGEVDNWGQSYPEGGIFDPETRRWRPLPAEPAHRDDGMARTGGCGQRTAHRRGPGLGPRVRQMDPPARAAARPDGQPVGRVDR